MEKLASRPTRINVRNEKNLVNLLTSRISENLYTILRFVEIMIQFAASLVREGSVFLVIVSDFREKTYTFRFMLFVDRVGACFGPLQGDDI